jgi:hypothetical protein
MLYRSRKVMALWAGMLTAVACVLGAVAPSASAAPAAKAGFYTVAAGGVASVSPAAIPNCGKGVGVRKVVATYKAKRIGSGGYRTDTLYCGVGGDHGYGYRHLEPHVDEYFGGWQNFSFSIAQTLKAPASVTKQSNGNYLEKAPIYQCFYEGYYYIWTFSVVPVIKSGSIVTAYGSRGKRVNAPCP